MHKSSFVVSLFIYFSVFKLNSHNKQLLVVCHDIQDILSSKVLLDTDSVISGRHRSSAYTDTFACHSSSKRLHDHS